MATQIDARVKQKTGVAADFAGYVLLEGEIALVRTSPSGPVWNFKVGPGNFDSLDWSLQNPGAAQEADTSTVFPTGVPGLYIPTENGTYNGVAVDLSVGYVQLIWDGTTLVKVEFPIDLSGYVTNSDLNASVNAYVISALGKTTPFPYSGTLPYRYYNTNNVDFVTSSPDVTQVDNGTSDTVVVTAPTDADALYLDTDTDIAVDPDNDIAFEAIINTGSGTFGIGPGYSAGGAVRGIVYLSSGILIRTLPRNNSAMVSGLPTLSTGDIIRFEISLKGATDQNFRILINGVVVYDDPITINIPVTNAKWQLVTKGTVNTTIRKMAVYESTYASKDYVNSLLHPASPQVIGFRVLPDRPNGAPSGGFTCTGLSKITRGKYAGCWLVGNDGRSVEGDASPYDPEVLVLDADFTRIVTVFPMPYSGHSVQDLAVDTSGAEDTFWAATAGDGKIRHFDLDGNEISGDVYDWAAAFPANPAPNALSYVPESDALWCAAPTGDAVLISCNPAASPRELDTLTLTNAPDSFYYEPGVLYYSLGGNGQNGHIREVIVATGAITTIYPSIERAQAIEGIYIDRENSELIIMNDGGYHTVANPALNIVIRYRI